MQLPDPENSWAVFVGTTTYSSTLAHKPLPGVRGNVEDLSEVLADPCFGGFREDHCVRLIDESNANEIVRSVKAAAEKARDVLLVYIAGHAEPKHDSFELYFCLPGSDMTDDLWHLEALPYSEIRDAMRTSTAKSKIVIVDSCFSGLALPDSLNTDATTMFAVYGAYSLTSVGPNDLAGAPSGERRTAFTGKLVELLTVGIDSQDELLTLQNLFPYLRSGLLADGQPSPRQHSTGTMNHLAVVRNRACDEKPVLSPDLAAAITSTLPGVRLVALDELERLQSDGNIVTRNRVTRELTHLASDSDELVASRARKLLNGKKPRPVKGSMRGAGRGARVRRQLVAPQWVSLSAVTGCCSTGALVLSGQTLAVSLLWAIPIAVIAHVVTALVAA